MIKRGWICAAVLLAACVMLPGRALAVSESLAGFGADISGAYQETGAGEDKALESVTEDMTESTEEDVGENAVESITEDITEEEQEPMPGKTEARGRKLWDEEISAQAEKILAGMTLEEKAAQLFFIAPEALTGVSQVTAAGEATREAFRNRPVGGIIYFEPNLTESQQVRDMLSGMMEISMDVAGVPVFLATDEEGGQVRRLSGRGFADVPYIDTMYSVGLTGEKKKAEETGKTIGTYLSDYGFNVDFAPVADIYSNPENTVIADRSFGNDAATVSAMVSSFVSGMRQTGVRATLKHFPGHGDTAEDSHAGGAASWRTLAEMEESELLPFRAGIDAGAQFVMAGHISLPSVLPDDTPASLSYDILTGLLRNRMGFEGIIITDALNMGAVTSRYGSADAAVQAFMAGADMILMPADFESAYQGILQAAEYGIISGERLDESVRRILCVKLSE